MDDVISRSAAIEVAMRYLSDDDGSCSNADEDPRNMLDDIECIPAIDVVPVVHAYWKKTYDLIDGHDGYECSACGYTKYFDHYAEGIALCKPYCCKCGARMDGEAE